MDVDVASFSAPFVSGFFLTAITVTALAGGLRAAFLAIGLSMLGYAALAMLPAGANFGWQQAEVEAVLLVMSELFPADSQETEVH